MTTHTPTTSIKSSISFYRKSKSLSEYGSKNVFKFYLLSSGEGDRDLCYVSRGRNIGILYRSILIVKSLKRTLYSLPKTTLMSPSTQLHNVNVTSIYQHTRTHNSNFFILWQIYVFISSWREGRNRCGFIPPYSSFRSKIHIYSCS